MKQAHLHILLLNLALQTGVLESAPGAKNCTRSDCDTMKSHATRSSTSPTNRLTSDVRAKDTSDNIVHAVVGSPATLTCLGYHPSDTTSNVTDVYSLRWFKNQHTTSHLLFTYIGIPPHKIEMWQNEWKGRNLSFSVRGQTEIQITNVTYKDEAIYICDLTPASVKATVISKVSLKVVGLPGSSVAAPTTDAADSTTSDTLMSLTDAVSSTYNIATGATTTTTPGRHFDAGLSPSEVANAYVSKITEVFLGSLNLPRRHGTQLEWRIAVTKSITRFIDKIISKVTDALIDGESFFVNRSPIKGDFSENFNTSEA